MIDITDILTKIEETDQSRVDKCLIYSKMVFFLKTWVESFQLQDTGNKINNILLQRIVEEVNTQVVDLETQVKNFIALNLIK